MAGTIEGGRKAAAANLAKNPNFYSEIGSVGGRNSNTGGFAAHLMCSGKCGLNPVLGAGHKVAQCAGVKGGMKSRRKAVKEEN